MREFLKEGWAFDAYFLLNIHFACSDGEPTNGRFQANTCPAEGAANGWLQWQYPLRLQ